MSLNGKNILVTGAGGFIGSHLSERLVREGANVKAFVHYNAFGRNGWLDSSEYQDEMEIVSGDIVDSDFVNHAVKGMDYVFHLAALIGIPYSYHAPRTYVRTNIEGTLNILQACRYNDVERVMHTSTSEVYGSAVSVPISEEHKLQGQSPYSASKIGADKIAESYFLSFNTPVVTVRPFNTFGPRQSQRAVIPTIISQLLEKDCVSLGSLSPTRDLNYVENTVDGFICASKAKDAAGRTINLGYGKEISIGDLVKLIADILGKQANIVNESERMRPENSEVERLLADNELAKTILKWEPEISLKDGLIKTIEWIRENTHFYNTKKYSV